MRLLHLSKFLPAAVFVLAVFSGTETAKGEPIQSQSSSVPDAQPQAPALSQRPEPTPAPQRPGRIHLDVVVTDKPGKPVSGLESKDFTLLDDGRPAKILSFQGGNGFAQKGAPPVEIILILDNVNVGFQYVANARQGIEKFLRQNGGHLAAPVSIFAFTNDGFKVLVQPSADGNAMATQLDQAGSQLRTLTRSAGLYGAIERFDLSIRWLAAIAKEVGARPGRKLLIWVGPGWPLLDRTSIDTSNRDDEQFFRAIVELSTNLREGHTALYSVSSAESAVGTFLYQDFLKGVKTPEKANPSDLGLRVIATQSGGRVTVPDNDLAGQLDKCVVDGSSFYTISFDPPPADKPNEYHDLKVQVDRAGLTARTNTGYYNQPAVGGTGSDGGKAVK
jgi:VWFA-related protein